MAELNETQQQEEVAGDKVRRSRSGLWVGIIVFGIIIAIAGAGFYLFQQLRSQQQSFTGEVNKGDMKVIELTKQITGYQSQIAAIQSQLATIEADVSGKNNHFTKTLADFSQLHGEKLEGAKKELRADIQQVQRQLGKTRGDWLVADAEYLLTAANQRLYLMGDVNTTREALEAADQRLRESGDAGVFKVREQIVKDIAALSAISVADIVGMYSSLQSLQEQVAHLNLLLPYSGKAVAPAAPVEQAEPAKQRDQEDKGLVDSAITHLEGLVTIKHSEHAIKEILTPEEAQFIQEQLRLKLEVVKLALVQQNEALYQLGLADAKKWTQQNFAENTKTAEFIAALDKFNAIKIRSQFPDISLSLKMLKDVTKLRIETDKALQAESTKVNGPAAATETAKPEEAPKSVEPAKAPESAKPVAVEKPAAATETKPASASEAGKPAQKPHPAE
ncbi:MAG: uroporphyrinogen-III C-methyltransferase [Methylococcales bacterium]